MLESQGFESLVGRTFNGYRVTRFIARGGMGMVYEAVQESLDRPVAIKFLYPHLSDDERFRDRFEREARAAARLSHPNIVRILDFGSEGSLFYMVQDFIDGQSLRERLTEIHQEGGTLRTETVLRIVEQVGSALSYAHEHGYVHRDVKPGNVLLTRNGQAYLTDFGVVKIVGANQLTVAGMIIGTPEYIAPEQSAGATDIGPAADQYSLAVVTYEMLVGRVPFQAPTPAAVMRMHLTDPPPPPTTILPWFPREVEAVLMRAMAKEPFDRFESVGEFVHALTGAVEAARRAAGGTITRPSVGALPTIADIASGAAQPVAGAAQTPAGRLVGNPLTPTGGVSGGTPPPSGTSTPSGATAAEVTSGRSNAVMLVGALAALAVIIAVAGVAIFMLANRGSSGGATTPAAAAGAGTPTAALSPTAGGTNTGAIVAAGTPVPYAGYPTATVAAGPTPPSDSFLAILFSSQRAGMDTSKIFIMNPDGTGQRPLASSRGHSWGPRVSANGTEFFFSSVAPGEDMSQGAMGGGMTGSGNHDVYFATFKGTNVADVQAENITNITAGYMSWDNAWSWSPDGKWIAFTSDRDGNWDIYKMTSDGKTIVRLTENPQQDAWPWWTPDGQQIVFSSDRDGTWQIYMMDADGSNVRQLTRIADRTNLYPAVSPDGTKIVFSSQVSAVNEGEIYAMSIDGSNLTRLTSTAALNNIPSWCPDSNKIVFESDRDGNSNIYMMNADGSGVVRLTDDPGEDTTPACMYIRRTGP